MTVADPAHAVPFTGHHHRTLDRSTRTSASKNEDRNGAIPDELQPSDNRPVDVSSRSMVADSPPGRRLSRMADSLFSLPDRGSAPRRHLNDRAHHPAAAFARGRGPRDHCGSRSPPGEPAPAIGTESPQEHTPVDRLVFEEIHHDLGLESANRWGACV
jgi:hypothetical protein